MKSIIYGFTLFILSGLHAQNANPYSPHYLDRFYNLSLEEDRDLLLEQLGTNNPYKPNPPPYNPNPPEPPPAPDVFYDGYLPIVIDNNTHRQESLIYVLVTGKLVEDKSQDIVLQFDPKTGKGTAHTFPTTGNTSSYAIPLSSLPLSSNGSRVLYVEQIYEATMWFSVGQPLGVTFDNATGKVTGPNFRDTTDPYYNTIYDACNFQFKKENGSSAVTVTAEAREFFSMPIYCSYQPSASATSKNSSTGIYYKQSAVFNELYQAFTAATFEPSAWLSTILPSSYSTNQKSRLRVVSPFGALNPEVSGPLLFDSNFYSGGSDNSEGSLPSYPNYNQAVWAGTASYNPVYDTDASLTLILDNKPSKTYISKFTSPGSLKFEDKSDPSKYVILSYGGSASTYIITQNKLLITSSSGVSEDEVVDLFTQGILAGFLPKNGDTILSPQTLQDSANSYFTNNTYLQNLSYDSSQPFLSNYPFYSIYSKILTQLSQKGSNSVSIQTMRVDNSLFPDIAVKGPFDANKTYIGITLCGLN